MSSTPMTYPETLAILRAIQTEPDILANACRTILKTPQLADHLKKDPSAIAKHMAVVVLQELNTDPIAATIAGIVFAGTLGAQVVRPDSIHNLFNQLVTSLAKAFASGLIERARQIGEDDEAEATKFMAQVFRDIIEMPK